MSRREIRRMLMEPKRRVWDRPWVLPVLMSAVLVAGIGIGVMAGVGILDKRAETKAWEQAEMAVERDRRAEAEAAARVDEAPVIPIIPVPMPRPGGPEDDGFAPEISAESEEPQALAAGAKPQPLQMPMSVRLPPLSDPPESAVPLILPQPPVRPLQADSPAWQRFAVPAPRVSGHPMIAVVIDDLGVDRRRVDKVLALRSPLTLAWMTYAEDLRRLTQIARQRGHELMLHVPMQPTSGSYDPGPDVLEVNLHPEEIRRRLQWGLSRFDGFVGINNHMGSRFTADRVGMRVVMEELKKRGLLFLDSVTTDKSVAPELARNYGVPFAARQIFIDNEQSVAAVHAQLAKAEAYARKHGAAIAIGHPHDATIEALSTWLPNLEARGFVLVPVTAIVKGQNGSDGAKRE